MNTYNQQKQHQHESCARHAIFDTIRGFSDKAMLNTLISTHGSFDNIIKLDNIPGIEYASNDKRRYQDYSNQFRQFLSNQRNIDNYNGKILFSAPKPVKVEKMDLIQQWKHYYGNLDNKLFDKLSEKTSQIRIETKNRLNSDRWMIQDVIQLANVLNHCIINYNNNNNNNNDISNISIIKDIEQFNIDIFYPNWIIFEKEINDEFHDWFKAMRQLINAVLKICNNKDNNIKQFCLTPKDFFPNIDLCSDVMDLFYHPIYGLYANDQFKFSKLEVINIKITESLVN